MRTSSRIILSIIVLWFSSQPGAHAANLLYQIKPKQQLPYRVSIKVTTPTSIKTMQGVIVYTGVSVAEKIMTLKCKGGLKQTSKSTSTARGGRARFGGPPSRPRAPWERPDFRGLSTDNTSTLVITQRGDVESMRGDSQLPFLLGNLSLMPFEALPDSEKKAWQSGSGVTITSETSNKSRFGSRFGPFANQEESVQKGGGELSKYEITKDDGKLVTITKTYSLTSPAAVADETGYTMKGTGSWIFNRELGLSESMEQTLEFVQKDEHTTVKFPMTIKWNRMTDEQFEQYKQKVEEDRKALQTRVEKMQKDRAEKAAKAALLPPKAMNKFQKQSYMRQLNTSNWRAIKGCLFVMNGTGPSRLAKDDMDLATKVGTLRGHAQDEVKAGAEKIWAKWKASFEEYASDEQKAQVAAATGKAEEAEMAEDNPFEEVDSDDGKGQRTWSDATGRFKIDAEFVKLDGRMVTLKKADGKTMQIPKARLSAADQKIVDKLSK